jgi:Protein of unknown function (DUF3800)
LYALYLDGSGTHGGSPVFVLAGIAVHEHDAYHLQQRFSNVLSKLPAGKDPRDYELHAAEIKSPTRKRGSNWQSVPWGTRLGILKSGFRALETYDCMDPKYPCAFFGAVVERSYRDYEQRAWEELLHRFDEMLGREAQRTGEHQRGVVVHDRDATETRVQNWADKWRLVEGRIGVLTHMIDVPFFADSRSSRLLQAADFVAWSLWRYYGLPSADEKWINPLWRHFDSADGTMHGLVHITRSFRFNRCTCPPCASRTGEIPAVDPGQAAEVNPPGS